MEECPKCSLVVPVVKFYAEYFDDPMCVPCFTQAEHERISDLHLLQRTGICYGK